MTVPVDDLPLEVAVLQRQLKAIAHAELEDALRRLPHLSADEQRILQRFAEKIVQQVLQTPLHTIQQHEDEQQGRLMTALHQLFESE